MHAVISRLRLADPTRLHEVVRRMMDGMVPEIDAHGGVDACHVVACAGSELYVVALFDGAASAEAGRASIDEWVHRHVALLVHPEVAVSGVVHSG